MIAYHDHNYNITSITNFAGDVLERISYTPYGQPTYDVATINGDYDADGDIDSSDNTSFQSCDDGGSGVAVSGACRVFDFDNDKDVDASDLSTFQTKYSGSTEIYRSPNSKHSENRHLFSFQSLRRDVESQLLNQRMRFQGSQTSRFVQAIGKWFPDSNRQYNVFLSNPTKYVNPAGLTPRAPEPPSPMVPSSVTGVLVQRKLERRVTRPIEFSPSEACVF